ncbi:zf-C3HC-domain-containing protein, partial [Pholiota conissans]
LQRKLDDAFQVLDSAVTPATPLERPPPAKRAYTARSLYSTLAKYGIKSGTTTPGHLLTYSESAHSSKIVQTRNTPHLTAILARAASRTKNSFSFRSSSQTQAPAPPLPATAEYRPSSLPSFLARLATFKLATYANKPPSIDAVAASKCGWINDGKDRLVCGLCNSSWVVAGREGLSRDAANTLAEKQRVALVEAHKNGCPWKTRQCEYSIYCIPLQSPAAMIKDIKCKAETINPVIKDVLIKHPLSTSQTNSLREIFSSFAPQSSTDASSRMDEDHPQSSPPPPSQLSETAILVSLFGWSLVPPAAPESLRRSSTTRTPSRVPSMPASPALSRASSVSLPHTPPKASDITQKPSKFAFRMPSTLTQVKPENALLQCELCQRRLGLWAFSARSLASESTDTLESQAGSIVTSNSAASRPKKTLPRRSFDLLKEHRSYCPYVVRSTVVPSLPVPPTPPTPGRSGSSNGHTSNLSLAQYSGKNGTPGALEGWRAALIVVMRYGMAQRQRIEYNFMAPKDVAAGTNDDSDAMEVDNVKAMVTGVKTRGGKDLLRYVRGLLG